MSQKTEDSSAWGGVMTPAETVTDVSEADEKTYVRAVASGKVITLINGLIELESAGNRGSIHWKCEQTKGWLGFRNAVSGNLLGHERGNRLWCQANVQKDWEHFCVRPAPGGGYILLMLCWNELWCVGFKQHEGKDALAKIGHNMERAILWEFIKV